MLHRYKERMCSVHRVQLHRLKRHTLPNGILSQFYVNQFTSFANSYKLEIQLNSVIRLRENQPIKWQPMFCCTQKLKVYFRTELTHTQHTLHKYRVLVCTFSLYIYMYDTVAAAFMFVTFSQLTECAVVFIPSLFRS